MRLLVSVREPGEVAAALAGGAEIVDAKDPARGALGAVAPAALRAIARAVPPDVPLSVALGDAADPAAGAALVAATDIDPRPGGVFVKIGLPTAGAFAGPIVAAAVRAAKRHPARPAVIAVVYADMVADDRLAALTAAVAAAGAAGMLVDTARKQGRTLFDAISGEEIGQWIADARRHALLAAVGGGLTVHDLPRIASFAPDVIGVRGAACLGGREGRVDVARVRALRAAIDAHSSRSSVAASSSSRATLTTVTGKSAGTTVAK